MEKKLNDSLINAAQVLLDAQFPNIEGFQNTIWGHNLDFKPVTLCKPSVQILHTGMLHINFLCTLALSQAYGFIWGSMSTSVDRGWGVLDLFRALCPPFYLHIGRHSHNEIHFHKL